MPYSQYLLNSYKVRCTLHTVLAGGTGLHSRVSTMPRAPWVHNITMQVRTSILLRYNLLGLGSLGFGLEYVCKTIMTTTIGGQIHSNTY